MQHRAALDFVESGTDALAPHQRGDGELLDPVFGEPTQYGTAYFAELCAAVALLGNANARARRVAAARAGAAAVLAHLHDLSSRPALSSVSGAVATPQFHNHRDFMWPALLRTTGLLRRLGGRTEALEDQIASVAVPAAFAKRPPNNWASVWLSGEQLRVHGGIGSRNPEFDRWVGAFFESDAAIPSPLGAGRPHVDLDFGLYAEPGLPNSYDLFTRAHLFEVLRAGYDGPHRSELEQLVIAGARRSLGVQLSSGSLASAHRSTGQLWTLTLQVAYLHAVAQWTALSDPDLAKKASDGAQRALRAAVASLRSDATISPAENALPAAARVGYEPYTMDAHYTSLALAFLARALLEEFCVLADPPPPSGALVEGDPVSRALLHDAGFSLHLNLAPQGHYDGFGIADLTCGLGRRLNFGAQARWGAVGTAGKGTPTPLNLGVGRWEGDDTFVAVAPLTPLRPGTARIEGNRLVATADFAKFAYRFDGTIAQDRVRITESAGEGAHSLLVPVVRDRGSGTLTEIAFEGDAVRLRHGSEVLVVRVLRPLRRALLLEDGCYASRHGTVALLRLDAEGEGALTYEVVRAR